jgi:HAMP domain-containing protein
LRHSIRWRLVALFLLLALASSGVFLFGTQRIIAAGWQGWARPLVADYVDRLAAEIGSPPDAARAAALVARLPCRCASTGRRCSTTRTPGRRPTTTDDRHDRPPDAAGGWSAAAPTATACASAWPCCPTPTRPRRLGWLHAGRAAAADGAAYAVVHRLLRPLGPIGDGVARFGRGDFARPSPLPRRDELGELAERINGMARSLHGRLEDQRRCCWPSATNCAAR